MLRLFNKKHWEIVRNGKFEINGQKLENLYVIYTKLGSGAHQSNLRDFPRKKWNGRENGSDPLIKSRLAIELKITCQ